MESTAHGRDHDFEVPHPRRVVLSLLERYTLIAAWIVVIIIFGAIKPAEFLTTANFASIFSSQSVLIVLTFSLLFTLTAGEYDLSIGGVLSLSGMTTALLDVNYHWPIVPAVVVGLLAGTVVGLVNALFVVGFGVESFIVTLGTGTVASGLVLWISGSNTITGVSNGLVNAVIVPKIGGLSFGFLYGVIACLVFWYLLEYTPLGRRYLFVGRAPNVARLSGLHVNRIRFSAFVVGAFVASIAGVMYVGTSASADPTSGPSLLLPAFAAAFLGSTSIFPGRFNAPGAFVAVYFLVTGITGLAMIGVGVFVQDLFYGGALVIAVTASYVLRRRKLQIGVETTVDIDSRPAAPPEEVLQPM